VTRATSLTAFRQVSEPIKARPALVGLRSDRCCEVRPDLSLNIYSELAVVEAEWRRFERVADCTAFQTFDWLAAWQRHVGERAKVLPVIAIGRFGDGEIAFLLPLSVVPGRLTRRLCWLGQDLSDYNAPLLARNFGARITPDRFLAAWRELLAQMQCEPLLRHDWIEFEKMPQTIGGQINPFTYLGVTPNPSGGYVTGLGDNWEAFYHAKRSSATRRRDRTKRRHMSKFGEVRFTTAATTDKAQATLQILMEQKTRSLARKGIADIFAPPGHREFYLDLASNPKTRQLVHISRVDIGDECAAANFGMIFGDCYYHVLASYVDTEVAHYGPGALHLRELMAHAIERGLKRFDFTIGDEPYKLEWCDSVLKLCDYTASATWRAVPLQWSSSVRRRVKRFIKQTPLLWRLATHTRAMIGALRRPCPSPAANIAGASERSPAPAVRRFTD